MTFNIFTFSKAEYDLKQLCRDNRQQQINFKLYTLQEELGRFIKFSCNQDRLPMCPGDTGGVPPPPYPMKIAPHDKRDEDPDLQLLRVETCMFMVKLPRYSTFETMREKLLYAITCSTDPLSGQFTHKSEDESLVLPHS